jgi:L-threonine kinase
MTPPAASTSSTCATVAIPGTCGELVQGLINDVPCLVSCPIDRYAKATLTLLPEAEGWQFPPDRPKVEQALRLGVAQLGLNGGGKLGVSSELPPSKGYGSSTADIASTLYGLGYAAGRPFDGPEVARIAIQVEPSDSVMFDGLALLAHVTGERHELLGEPPPLDILLLDTGGTVDTLDFNDSVSRDALRRQAPHVRDALEMLREGIRRGDASLVAQAATLSAQAHQAILPKPALDSVLEAGRGAGGLGVCVAHSGTLIGVLFAPLSPAERMARLDVLRAVCDGFDRLEVAGWASLVSGGPRLVDPQTKSNP